MTWVNTTSGPVWSDPAPEQNVNTSRVVEEDLVYTDEEPEVLTAVSASGWYAQFDDGRLVPLVLWSVWDDGSVTGVVVGEDGRIDASRSVESLSQFQKYEKATNNEKE